MQASVNVFVLASTASLFLASQALAGGSGQDGADRFVMSAAIHSGVLVQDWNASLDSQICRGCTFPNAGAEQLRPSDTGDTRDVTPFVGAGLELMTPELPVPGSLRFFIGGEFAAAFGTERKVAREGDPGPIGSPNPVQAVFANFNENNATGQGSDITIKVDNFFYGARAGFSVPFELYGRALRLKPSVAWIRYELDSEGRLSDAECTQVTVNTNECNPLNPTNPGGFLRSVGLETESSDSFDGIGGGLDLEMDTGRIGPLGSALFIGARVYKILGDRSVEMETTPVTVSDVLGTDAYRARFTYEVDEWMYRIGVGFRLQWIGSGG